MVFRSSFSSLLAFATLTLAIDLRRDAAQASSTNTACALAASAASSYAVASPSAASIEIQAHLAHDCLQTIPNRPGPAIDFLNAFESYLAFQSDKDTYLLHPPTGFLWDGVDIDGYMQDIRRNVIDGNYHSEYDFQVDVKTMLLKAKDGHLSWVGDATDIFSFKRQTNIASVSSDGVELPQVYVIEDLIRTVEGRAKLVPVTGYSPSPIKLVNGVNVLTYLFSECLVGMSQDPDTLYNQQFFQLAKEAMLVPSLFHRPGFYPGDVTNVTLANGTVRTYINSAIVNYDLGAIQTGDDAYQQFCLVANKHHGPKRLLEKRQLVTSSWNAGLPFYPKPIITHSEELISGYYLDGPGLEDVAVLAINSFEPVSQGGELEFQQVLQAFLAAAPQAGKRKLVIDLQGNGGGFLDLGLDTFTQLFPSLKPNVKSNTRSSIGMDLLAQTAALVFQGDVDNKDLSNTEINLAEITPFAYQSVMTPEVQSFHDFNSFYGPVVADNGNFTHFFQNNYTDPHATDVLSTGIIITGTNNRSQFTQPFAASDTILLYDGYCASTCTTFSEFMKNHANVQSIVVGGRPQTGPQQAVGGIKGTQVFPFDAFPIWVDLFQSAKNLHRGQAQGTIFENFTTLPYLRSNPNRPGGVNGRNSFRIGDGSNTPLQYVYEAADCRIWWTQDMLHDPTFLWSRVAELAFKNRTGTQFSSPYCIRDSTVHPTSISGGWERGKLGPQTPPENAKLQDKGWIVNGTSITVAGPAEEKSPVVVEGQRGEVVTDRDRTSKNDTPRIRKSSQVFMDACDSWNGDSWLVKLVCGVLSP